MFKERRAQMIKDFKIVQNFFSDKNWGSFLENAVAHCYIGSKYWQKR